MRQAGWAAIVAVGAVAMVGAVFFGVSQALIARKVTALYPAIVADRSPRGVAEGDRLSRIAFCQGCHGAHGEGGEVEDEAGIVADAPGFAWLAATHSDAELARAIRHGVAKDGHAMFVMPIRQVGHFSDADIAAILGWIRSVKPTASDKIAGGMRWTAFARWKLLTGQLAPNAFLVPVRLRARPADAGAYFTRISCLQCHKLHAPSPIDTQVAPPLAQVGAAYDRAAFHRLLRTGRGVAPRDLGWMSRAARSNLKYLDDSEITQIQAYLVREEAARPTQ